MVKVAEYERRASDCRKMATKTANQTHKRQLLEMAEAWDMLAKQRRVQLSEKPLNGHQLPHKVSDTAPGTTTSQSD